MIIPSYWNPEKAGINIDNYTIDCQEFLKSEKGLIDIFKGSKIDKNNS